MSADDFAAMTDPEFLEERRRLHDELDELGDEIPSANPEDNCRIRERYRQVEAEFLRRAGLKWQQVS